MLLLLEHVNINVGNYDVAESFYGPKGLGGSIIERGKSKTLHVNIGSFTQFHL
eukprot:Awhi_evm1s13816